MRNFTKLSVLFFLLVGILACNNRAKEPVETKSYIRDTLIFDDDLQLSEAEKIAFKKSIDSLFSDSSRVEIPPETNEFLCKIDEIQTDADGSISAEKLFLELQKKWTPEQRKLKKTMLEIEIDYIKVVDGKLTLNMTREDLVKKGLPSLFYDYYKQYCSDLNFTNEKLKKKHERILLERKRQNEADKKQLAQLE